MAHRSEKIFCVGEISVKCPKCPSGKAISSETFSRSGKCLVLNVHQDNTTTGLCQDILLKGKKNEEIIFVTKR